jgi:hypothetical protein
LIPINGWKKTCFLFILLVILRTKQAYNLYLSMKNGTDPEADFKIMS